MSTEGERKSTIVAAEYFSIINRLPNDQIVNVPRVSEDFILGVLPIYDGTQISEHIAAVRLRVGRVGNGYHHVEWEKNPELSRPLFEVSEFSYLSRQEDRASTIFVASKPTYNYYSDSLRYWGRYLADSGTPEQNMQEVFIESLRRFARQ